MDTTDAYIDMRLAAIPELGRGAPPSGLFNGAAANRVWVDTKGSFYVKDGPIQCQLERQDQLQAMVRGERHNHLLAHEFALWWHGGEELGRRHVGHSMPGQGCDSSMEQLWIGFVQKELHGKTWDGKEWAK